MFGPEILVRTMSNPGRRDKYKNEWQYLSRGDHHSKVACWGILFDLLRTCALLRKHVEAGQVAFGINHEMKDFVNDRKKDLDLVLCTPSSGAFGKKRKQATLASLMGKYDIHLTTTEQAAFDLLPELAEADVGSVLVALEAKACMTAHQRALPRFYDELNSSHQMIHASSDQAIATGLAIVNVATDFLSPDLNKANKPTAPVWSRHRQPSDASLAIEKAKQLPRRSRLGDVGFDAFSTVVIDCRNDGSRVTYYTGSPAPQPGDIYHYASMIDRMANHYSTRFKDI